MDLLRTLSAQVDPAHTAIVVIDVQRDFCSSDGAMGRVLGLDMSEIQAAVTPLNDLVETARQRSMSVVWVREVFSPGRMLANQQVINGSGDDIILIRDGTDGVEWYEGLTPPLAGEPVFTKWNYDAFENTDLDLWLRARDIRALIFVGFTTNVCVETSARHAYIKGYYVLVAEDCTGAPSRAEHDAALVNIGKYFGRVETSSAIKAAWESTAPVKASA
jgi:ureidoacrylate peracid hydrolase